MRFRNKVGMTVKGLLDTLVFLFNRYLNNKIMTGNFKKIISSGTPVLVDFYADWCQPCKVQSPVIHELAEEYKEKVRFIKINVDKNQAISEQYMVQSIPTLIIFKNGQAKWRQAGVTPKNVLKNVIETVL